MRMHRVLTALIGLALMGLGPVALTSSASAMEEARALPKREISSSVVDKRNKLFLKGNVNPGWAGKPVIIQKKNCKGERCNWFGYTSVKTNEKGGFRARITAPRKGYSYWRAKVKKAGGYGTSYSSVWRTYTV